MGYQQEREQFISGFVRTFPTAPYSVAVWLLRQATAEQRWNEIDCSIDVGDKERERLEKRSGRRLERVEAAVENIGGELIPGGDPRGYPFALRVKGDKTDRGLGVPGRGLPASCFR